MSLFYVHPQGICESTEIGEGTNIWAFSHVLSGARIGSNCNICDNVFIENDVLVGDRVTIKCGVQLWDGITLEDDTFVGPNVTFTNDDFPRSKQYQGEIPRTVVERGASVGANSTVLPSVTIGRGAMVGAGSVVTRDVPPHAKVCGNPARIMGYIDLNRPVQDEPSSEALSPEERQPVEFAVEGVTLYTLAEAEDLRGKLAVAETDRDIPFEPKRFFVVYDVPTQYVRGEHAHKQCKQFLVALKGSASVMVDDGNSRDVIVLDKPNLGLYIPEMIWAAQYGYSSEALLLVFASHHYDPEDYIRDFNEFLRYKVD